MNKYSIIGSAASGILSLGLAGPAAGQDGAGHVEPQNFDQFCAAEVRRGDLRGRTMEEELKQKFFAELDRAERAIAAGDLDTTRNAMALAGGAVGRTMIGDKLNLSVKCHGESAARRWFNVNLGIWRLATGDERLEFGARKEMRYSLFANGADEVAKRVSNVPERQFKGSFRPVQRAVDEVESERDFGAFILSEEERVVAAGREALASLRKFADGKVETALGAEAVSFSRPATEQEQAAGQLVGATGQMAQAMAGVDIDSEAAQQTMLVNLQSGESLQRLKQARYYEIDDESRTNRRAEQRGDTLLARADDAALALEARDMFYSTAENYYRFCACDRQRSMSEKKRESIQPALQAKRAEQERKMEDARAELEKKAEAARDAVEKMQKTEAEKKVFKDEADAMEAELGF
jgi:hypothetical protein